MTIARVQYKKGSGQGYTNGLDVAIALDSTPIVGNLLIALIAYSGGCSSVNSVTTTNVTWSKVVSKQHVLEYGSTLVEIWKGVISANPSKTTTINFTTLTYHSCSAIITEYSGLSGDVDKTASNACSAVGTSGDSGTTDTTVGSSELWIACTGGKAHAINDANLVQSNPTNSFTLVDQIYILCVAWGWGATCGYEEKIVSSTGTANTGTTYDASTDWIGVIATFKALLTVSTKTYLSDVVLKEFDKTKTYSLDVVLSIFGFDVTKEYSLDVLTKQLDTIKTYPFDVALKRINDLKTYQLDVVQKSINQIVSEYGNWMVNWLYRKSHIINAAAGAGENYQKQVTVHYGAGTDSDDDVYLSVANQSEFLKISIPTVDHTNYGLSYPVTYCIDIPASSANLTAWHKHALVDNFSQLTAKTSSDFFNGIECVRWDYANNKAYISVAFDSATDDIYIGIKNVNNDYISISYNSIPQYYDNRKCAVIITADDWVGRSTEENAHIAMGAECTPRHIVATHGIVTLWSVTNTPPTWASVQAELNGGYAEVANHSKYHQSNPTESDADIITSLAEIKANLDLPSLYKKDSIEYVVGWIIPFGGDSATQRTKLGQNKYLCDRSIASSSDGWATWDAVYGLYNSYGGSLWMGSDGITDLATLNAKFDAVYTAGGIYHIMCHPSAVNWGVGQYAQSHLDHVKDKLDVWYVGFGAAYTYHYVQERGKISTNITSSNLKCRTDFGDIRFTDDSGVTLLDCWMESKTDNSNAVFWVKVADSLETDPITIYIYYGNANATYPYLATDLAQGEATFPFFDNFTSSPNGWTLWSNVSISGGYLNIAPNAYPNWSSAKKTRPSGLDDYRFRFRANINNCNNFGFFGCPRGERPDGAADPSVPFFFIGDSAYNPINAVRFTTQGSVSLPYLGPARDSLWHILEVLKSGSSYKDYWDALTSSGNDATVETGTKVWFGNWGWNPTTITIDWVFLAKYISPEPAHGAWGTEESIYSYIIDVMFKKFDTLKTYSFDTIFKIVVTKPYLLDVIQIIIDALKIYSLDVSFSKIVELSYLIEILLKEFDKTKTYSLDVAFKKESKISVYKLDAITKNLNSLLFWVDVVFSRSDMESFLIDVMLELAVPTSIGSPASTRMFSERLFYIRQPIFIRKIEGLIVEVNIPVSYSETENILGVEDSLTVKHLYNKKMLSIRQHIWIRSVSGPLIFVSRNILLKKNAEESVLTILHQLGIQNTILRIYYPIDSKKMKKKRDKLKELDEV